MEPGSDIKIYKKLEDEISKSHLNMARVSKHIEYVTDKADKEFILTNSIIADDNVALDKVVSGTVAVPSNLNGRIRYVRKGSVVAYTVELEFGVDNGQDITLTTALPYNHSNWNQWAPLLNKVGTVVVGGVGTINVNARTLAVRTASYANNHSIRGTIVCVIA